MGVFRFDGHGEMYLDTAYPGFTPERVKENCSFDLNISRVRSRVRGETLPPGRREIELFPTVIGPEGVFLV